MMKIAMSRPASGLLRRLLARAGEDRDRILLTDLRSTDWQSLTFVGERHRLKLRIAGDNPQAVARRLGGGLDYAEFEIPGHVVADILVVGEPRPQSDGSLALTIEALTIEQ